MMGIEPAQHSLRIFAEPRPFRGHGREREVGARPVPATKATAVEWRERLNIGRGHFCYLSCGRIVLEMARYR